MQVREIMTSDPACCTPDTNLQDVACMMIECDCGAIPVVDDLDSGRVIGMITDRDITCRTVAQRKNPLDLTTLTAKERFRQTLRRTHRPQAELGHFKRMPGRN